jgi:hypothetical protein
VALAGDQHDVIPVASAMAAAMAARRSPISRAPAAAGQHGLADVRRVFAARIVVGDDDQVGPAQAARPISGRLPHRDRRPRRTR